VNGQITVILSKPECFGHVGGNSLSKPTICGDLSRGLGKKVLFFFSGFFGHRSHLLGYLSLGNVNPCKREKQEAFETIAGRGWEEHIEPQPTWRLIVVTIYLSH